MIYDSIDDYVLNVDAFGVQGWTVTITKWYEDCDCDEEYEVLYDRNVIADSLYEAVTDALCEVGVDFEVADAMATEWEIFAPEDEDDE
jgi:hypothetical protein